MGRPAGIRRSREAAALGARLHDVAAGLAVGIALMKGAAEDRADRDYFGRGLATFEAALAALRSLASNPLLPIDRRRNLKASLLDEARRAGVDMEFEVFGEPDWLDVDE